MPFSSNEELPERVKNNIPSERGKDIFRNAFNSSFDEGNSESVAFATGWAALENAGFTQNEGGEWVKKSMPDAGDVHVPSTSRERERRDFDKDKDGFVPPKAAQDNAKKVLRWREEHPDEIEGMTEVGWRRANQLASGEAISLDTVKRISQFARHLGNADVAEEHKGKPWMDAGHVAILGWGGREGIEWAQRVVDREKTKKSIPLTIKSRLTSQQCDNLSDVLSAAYDNLGPSPVWLSLKSDVASVAKSAQRVGIPFCAIGGRGDAESLFVVPESHVSVSVKPSTKKVAKNFNGNIGRDEIISLIKSDAPPDHVGAEGLAGNSNSGGRQDFIFVGSGQVDVFARQADIISKSEHVVYVGGGDSQSVSVDIISQTPISNNEASPIGGSSSVLSKKSVVPGESVSGGLSDTPTPMCTHRPVILKQGSNGLVMSLKSLGDNGGGESTFVGVQDLDLLGNGYVSVISHTSQYNTSNVSNDIEKRYFHDDAFTTPMEAQARSHDLGMDGHIHVHQSDDGQAIYMPGSSHEEYMETMNGLAQAVDEYHQYEHEYEGGLKGMIKELKELLFGKKEEKEENMPEPIAKQQYEVTGKVLKIDNEQRIVYGWASVITEKGEPVVDTQGDIIGPDELVKAVNDFMKDERVGKVMHEGEPTGMIVHSMPLTMEIAKALGIETEREGWIVGYYVSDDAVWKRVKDGDFKGFSIGGEANRVAVDE